MIRAITFATAVLLALPATAQDKPNWNPRTYTCADYAAAADSKDIGEAFKVTMAGSYMYGLIHAHLDAAGKRAESQEMWDFTRQGMETCLSGQKPETPWADVSFSVAEQVAKQY